MLRADDRIDVMIERLAELPPGDRRAVLTRLSRTDAARVMTLLASRGEQAPVASYSTDIAARIADAGDTLTPATQAALARAVAGRDPVVAPRSAVTAPTSLLSAARRWLAAGR